MNKKIVAIVSVVILSLLALSGFSQTVSEPYKLWPRSNFRPPQDTTIAPERLGELRYKQSDGKFYKCISLTGLKWTEFGAGGSGTPGGSTTQVQYNNAGSFAGSASLVWDNANTRLSSQRLTVSSTGSGTDNEYPFQVYNATTGADFRIGVAGGSSIGGTETQIWASGSPRIQFFSDFGIRFIQNRVGNGNSGMIWQGLGGGASIGLSNIFVGNTNNAGPFTATTGEQIMVSAGDNFSGNENWQPSSGNATYTMYRAMPLVNTTGTYAGVVRGFLFTPSITSSTGVSFTAFQSTIGDWRVGGTGGIYVNEQDSTATPGGGLIYREGSTGKYKITGGQLLTTGTQTIDGTKTFSSSPRIPGASHVFASDLRLVATDGTNFSLGVVSNNVLSRLNHELSTTKTAAYTIGSDDEQVIPVDATSAAFTITLPSASVAGAGRAFIIKKIDGSANAVTVDGDASETIDGSANYSLSAQWKYVKVISDGTNWLVVGSN